MSDESQGGAEDLELVAEAMGGASEESDGFVYFRMAGGRFESGKGMPAAAVPELQRYAELVYEVARLRWLEAHPGRSNVRGLREAFDLRLVEIREGSALPVFQLAPRRSARDDEDDDLLPLFATARDIVNETIAAVAVDRLLPPSFPPRALPQLKRIGRTLEGQEAIALAAPRAPGVSELPATDAVLTPQVRDVISLIDELLVDEPGWVEREGVVTELDGTKGTFRLDMVGGGSVLCHLGVEEREVAETVKAVLAADGVTAPDVMVAGTAQYGARGVLKALLDVNEVSIIRSAAEKALMVRLSELSELGPDWWGPGTRAPGDIALRHAREIAPRLALVDRRVAVGADGDGSIVLEWWSGKTACTVEIQADGDMYLFAEHTDAGTHREAEAEFNADAVIRFVETGEFDA